MTTRNPTNSNEHYRSTESEIREAADRLSYLRNNGACCGNCHHRDTEKFISLCTLKDKKRVESYNICIHHRKSGGK